MGLPFPLALALWVALTDVIPVVGALLGAVPVVAIAATHSVGLLVATTAYFIVYQQVENYLIVPRVMRRTVELSPPTVVLAALTGGMLARVPGALLALPVAAFVKAVWMILVERRIGTVREASLAEPPRRRTGRVRPLP